MKKLIFIFSYFYTFTVFAAPICDDLAQAACAPGRYDDGTGVVRSKKEVLDQLIKYGENIKPNIDEQIKNIFRSSEGEYFKQKAMGALGLAQMPMCKSAQKQMQQQCEQNLIEGVSELVQQMTIKSLVPNSFSYRTGNLEELAYIIRDQNFKRIVSNVNQKITDDLVNKEQVNKIKNQIFPEVKKVLIARLKELNLPQQQLNLIITKINGIGFEASPCSEDADQDYISNLLTNNATF